MLSEQISSEYDIVIVGAGPAGCSVSKFLSKDYTVLLLDRSDFPRNKPCGGILVEESQTFLEPMHPPSSIFARPTFLNVKFIDWDNDLELEENRKLWNISRDNFDYWLLGLCKDIDFSPKTRVLQFRQEEDKVKLLLEKRNKQRFVKCKYLVGANGANSNFRDDIKKVKTCYYTAIQQWIKNKNGVGDYIYFIYDSKITDFMGWIIPKNNFLIVGLGLHSSRIKTSFDLFRKRLKEKRGIYGKGWKRELHPIFRPSSEAQINLGQERIMLVGEAAGLVSPSTGEGISFALRSGYFCALALNSNFENALSSYREHCLTLLKEIKSKILKAKNFSDKVKRPHMLRQIILKNTQW